MATGWMKSLQCKSRAFDDVAPNHRRRRHCSGSSDPTKTTHRLHSLSTSASCRNSFQNLKDIVETTTTTTTTTTKPKMQKPPNQPPPPPFRRPAPAPAPPPRSRSASAESFFPSLMELPQGHPSRNVVEIIFHTGWGEKPFSGRVEMVFKVQNLNRTVARFEEYREMVKSRAATVGGGCGADGEDDQARCVADGNEVMRFYCLGATSGGGAYEAGCGAWELYGGKGAALCTYSGSACAHEKGGGGSGRRAMLVCRVIAGRVCKEKGYGSLIDGRVGYDSVNKENGELLVFDTRALLPCFLIIYNKL